MIHGGSPSGDFVTVCARRAVPSAVPFATEGFGFSSSTGAGSLRLAATPVRLSMARIASELDIAAL